jgi:hypothetical protein
MSFSQWLLRVSCVAAMAAFPVAAVTSVGPYAGPNPSIRQIDSMWAVFSGGKAGKLVYGDTAALQITTLDLVTGEQKHIAPLLIPVWPGWTWGLCYCLRWSPDGTRISFQNYDTLEVMNADGSNLHVVATYPKSAPDNTRHSWNGNNKIFYTDHRVILSVVVNPDNTAGRIDTVYRVPPSGNGYTSVGASGDYVCWMDESANAPYGGGHRDQELKISTGEVKDMVQRSELDTGIYPGCNRRGDGCQLIMSQDGSGTVMYSRGSHADPSYIVSSSVDVHTRCWDTISTMTLGHVSVPVPLPGLSGIQSDTEYYGLQQYAWSNDVNYMVHMGKMHAPRYAWIRYLNVPRNQPQPWLFLGGTMNYPDLYVGSPTGAIRTTRASRTDAQLLRVVRTSAAVMQVQVNTSEKYSVAVYDAKGAVELAQSGLGARPQDVALSRLSKGFHIARVTLAGSGRIYQTTILVK